MDHEGEVLEYFVTKHRDHKAALKLLRKPMTLYDQPQEIVTNRLRSYGVAKDEIGKTEKLETVAG